MEPQMKEQGGHMVMTNVHREIKKKYLNIDTRFQEEYHLDDFAEFKFQLPQTINNVQSMKVVNIEIPASIYNFSFQRKNTYFTVENSAGTKMAIMIEDGNYTFDTLATEIQNQLSSSVNGISDIQVTLDPSTHKLRFDNIVDSNTTLTGTDATKKSILYKFNFDVDESGNSDKLNFKSKLGWLLGFREPSYTIHEGGNIVSETFANLHPLRYLYLNIDEYAQANPSSFITPTSNSYTNPHAIARLALDPNTYSFGSVICGNNACGKLLSDRRTYSGKTNIQNLHIQLLDELGNLVDINQMDFSFALEIEYL
jgi:hypothetical protein